MNKINKDTTTISQLPKKLDVEKSDHIAIENTDSTYNVTLEALKEWMTNNSANGMTVRNNQLFLTKDGEIINGNNGITLEIQHVLTYAESSDIRKLFGLPPVPTTD